MEKRREFNRAKRVILAVMQNRGWLSTRLIQQLARIRYPLNDRLLHYWKWGLVDRMEGRPALWRILPAGVARLEWLRKTMP